MDEERIKEIIHEELERYGLISDFEKNINGVDKLFKLFADDTKKRLKKIEDIIHAAEYKYTTEIKLVRENEAGVDSELVSRKFNE